MSGYVHVSAAKLCCRLVLALLLVAITGCAKSAKDTTGFAVTQTAVVDAAFDAVWQDTLDVLQEEEFLVYTRDKRGLFLAFTNPKRRFFVPQRHQFTVVLEPVSSTATRVTVETQFQKFGVTLLTDPAWHDRPTTDATRAEAILAGVQARAQQGLGTAG